MDTIKLYNYISDREAPRNKIFLPQNLVSLLEQGEKVVYYADGRTTINNNQFALLSSGNCLMTEKLPVNGSYRSTMLCFDNTKLADFFIKYACVIDKIQAKSDKSNKTFLVLEKDEFIRNYIASLSIIQ